MYVTATAATDTFGYALHSLTKEEAAARNAMLVGQAVRVKLWAFTDASLVSPKKLKKLIRDGVPQHLRRGMWMELCGGALLKQEMPEKYFTGLTSRPAPKALVQDVEAAIFRCMPGHQYMATPAGLNAAVKVIYAYMQHTGTRTENSTICVAAFLVTVIGLECLEDCFWILYGLLHNVLPGRGGVKELGLTCPVESLVLHELLRRRCPKLLAAFEAVDQSVNAISSRWFAHLFCGALPAETVVRIWDCMMFEGVKVLYRVALALLKRQDGIIGGNIQKLRNVEWRISRTFNADELLKVAFYGIGALPAAVISRSRKDVELQVEKERVSHAQRLEALFSPPRSRNFGH